MKQYEVFELVFTASAPSDNWVDVDLHAVFALNGTSTTVKGFYDGNNTYRVRYYPTQTGTCTWTVRGIVSAEGSEEVEPAAEGRHGMVHAEGVHFRFEDDSRYYPFGTTIYAMVHQPESHVDLTFHTLAKAPFNKIRFCVFPKHYDFNHNEPEHFAFSFHEEGKPDAHHPDPVFWQMLERRLAQLDAMGIQADLILFHPYDHWGFARMPLEDCLSYLDYLTRRLSAYPNVWWSLANEYDLMTEFEADWWYRFADYIHSNDPYGHLLSNHNFIKLWDFDDPNTTHCCIQVQGHDIEKVSSFVHKYGKPVLLDEMRYEGTIEHSWGNISAQEMTHRFWTAVTCGGYATHGETYLNKEEVLWWSKGGVLHGQSPERIGFLRKLVESLPGPLEIDPPKNFMSSEQMETFRKNPSEAPPMIRVFLQLSPEELDNFTSGLARCSCHVGQQVYLDYLGHDCPCVHTMHLPEEGSYTVHILDAWEMTDTIALTGASGTVKVPLPGKELTAVLAVRN